MTSPFGARKETALRPRALHAMSATTMKATTTTCGAVATTGAGAAGDNDNGDLQRALREGLTDEHVARSADTAPVAVGRELSATGSQHKLLRTQGMLVGAMFVRWSSPFA